MNQKKTVIRLSAIGIFGNIILSVFKLAAGLTGRSGAMVSDAVHSLSDVFATLIALLGVRMSEKAPDEVHPYGHDRFECIAAIALGLILAVTGLGIGYTGLLKILNGNIEAIEVPTLLPLIAALVSIAVKEGMFRYTLHYARRIRSAAFEADAWHHRSDALSSIGSFLGILAARIGFPVMDPVAGIVICLFILKAAADILRDAFMRMMDTSRGRDYEKRMRTFIESQEGVLGVDLLHSRYFGNKTYLDVEISVDRTLSLLEAHAIAERTHDNLEEKFKDVKHVMIHVNPSA